MNTNRDIRRALDTDRTIDITTTGRISGEPRRIEIWFFTVAGKIYLTGTPGRRSWYANLQSSPNFVFHMKGSTVADLAAVARPIVDDVERQMVLSAIVTRLRDGGEAVEGTLEDWLSGSPLVEVNFSDA
ncbi:hypothetical protein BKA04_001239 [Cryobacterium mesophilum]|uniref:DUF385 domain-containing protein n=1 Tax=Terrimesophilobacter mesophilus TaxID=433647 RepID=A0A4R8VCH7_9MICO|nr:nitroreductase/quinone reductase family protein [Terrimesophilobacter mesophilus]MBB5633016.1 hypothetical protein [Terrimesophilobacter mesophilus]TFB79782.1 DUF385 domain-containing protein [Terrimesophilobacter mesophilus]